MYHVTVFKEMYKQYMTIFIGGKRLNILDETFLGVKTEHRNYYNTMVLLNLFNYFSQRSV